MTAPRQLLPVVLRASATRGLVLLAALVFSGCLVPSLPGPYRPADPEVWYELMRLDDGTRVRAGGYLVTGEETRPLIEWQRPGATDWTRRAFEPLGTARHTHFVRALGDSSGLTLLAADEGRDTLAVVQLDWDGQVRGGVEISLGAPVRGYALGVVRGADQLVVGLSVGLPDGGAGGEAGVLWLRPDGEPLRAAVLPALASAFELALHADGALTLLGPARVQDRLDVGVARLSPAGQVDWVRALRFTDYLARLPSDLSVAADGDGGVLVVGHHDAPLQSRADLVLAQLNAAGGRGWQRAIQRPYPSEPVNWTLGPITQRAAYAPDGALYVAATAPYQRQGSTHLVLLELGPGGEVLRQSALNGGTQQISEVRATADAVRVRGSFFLECTFDRASLSGCDAPLALPPLVGTSTPTEMGDLPTEARSSVPQSQLLLLTPWTPPD